MSWPSAPPAPRRRHRLYRRGLGATLSALAVVLLGPAASAPAATREYWVVAEPTEWTIVPNGLDGVTGTPQPTTVFPTVVYRRYTRGWKNRWPDRPQIWGDGERIPGPLLHARVGDTILVHFKNRDRLTRHPHSMHFHGVHYKPSSDGAYVPGFSGRDAVVRPGKSYTYRLQAKAGSVGAWPYHDHSVEMHDSIVGGMYGGLSILGEHERRPDREFVVVFTAMKDFETINGRAFVGNTPIFESNVGDLVQWNVMAMGDAHHTFHVHGHRWRERDGTPADTKTLGPAESFRIRWREDAPGMWLYHCHVETHMARGMIGLYKVKR
jgi:FtsP/CotA-like multicopper oxidase with cupredoxin domain